MPKHKKNYLGHSPNVVEFERVGGGEEDVSDFLLGDLAAGQSLAAKNRRNYNAHLRNAFRRIRLQ